MALKTIAIKTLNVSVAAMTPKTDIKKWKVAGSLKCALGKVSEWFDVWRIKLSATMIVSRSHSMHPQSPSLILSGTVLKKSVDLETLGVTFYSKMAFEKHRRLVSRAAS